MIPNQLSNINVMANKGRLKNPAELIFHGLQHHPLHGSVCLEAAVIRLSHRNLLPMLSGWSDRTFLPPELIFQPVVLLQVENWIWLLCRATNVDNKLFQFNSELGLGVNREDYCISSRTTHQPNTHAESQNSKMWISHCTLDKEWKICNPKIAFLYMDEVSHAELSFQTTYTHIGTLVHNGLLYTLCVRCYHILKKQICLYHHLTYWSIHCYCTLSVHLHQPIYLL